MKNSVTPFMFAFMAFVLLSFIMGFAKATPEQPKQYIIIHWGAPHLEEKLTKEVTQKLSEGWHCEGGICAAGGEAWQAMSK